MKNKILTIIISICVILITLSIVYYFVIFLPQNKNIETKKELFKLNLDCEKYGLEKQGEHYTFYENMTIKRKYFFSPKLNSCVAEIEELSDNRIAVTLINMIKEENLIEYNSECESLYMKYKYDRYGEEGLKEECSTLEDVYNKKEELLK